MNGGFPVSITLFITVIWVPGHQGSAYPLDVSFPLVLDFSCGHNTFLGMPTPTDYSDVVQVSLKP